MKHYPRTHSLSLASFAALVLSPLAFAANPEPLDDSLIPLESPVSLTQLSKNHSAIGGFQTADETAYASSCKVGFSDWDSMNIIPGYAQNTFAYSPFWIQGCTYDKKAYVAPSINDHFHLAYEDLDMATCQILNTCPEHDPRDQDRAVYPHTSNETLKLTMYDDSGYLPFGIKSIRIPGTQSVKLCFKKRNESGKPWITNEDSTAAVDGRWHCWNKLGTGHWDLSNWINNVIEVTVTGTGGGATYGVDDIVFRTY